MTEKLLSPPLRGRVAADEHPRLAPAYFTPADIAAYMGLSTYTVQDLCRRGELRHVKAGRAIRIRREWADAYMSAREREPLR